jgi:cytochrome c
MQNSLTAGFAVLALLAGAADVAAQSCDAAAGEKVFARCRACHSADDGKNGVGPHLFGIVGRPVASVADYAYSEPMQSYAEGGTVWDREHLAVYLEKPKDEVPGTKMIFPGLPKEGDRANLICYLETVK